MIQFPNRPEAEFCPEGLLGSEHSSNLENIYLQRGWSNAILFCLKAGRKLDALGTNELWASYLGSRLHLILKIVFLILLDFFYPDFFSFYFVSFSLQNVTVLSTLSYDSSWRRNFLFWSVLARNNIAILRTPGSLLRKDLFPSNSLRTFSYSKKKKGFLALWTFENPAYDLASSNAFAIKWLSDSHKQNAKHGLWTARRKAGSVWMLLVLTEQLICFCSEGGIAFFSIFSSFLF